MRVDYGIGKSSEDYLETMIMLQEENKVVRSVDIATHLGVTKPSVSNAMKRLREEGYIDMDRSGKITLTPKGLEIAEKTYRKHKLLTEVFIKLGVDPKTAEEDACRIEHDISDETFNALCEHIEL
ncbi:MAG: metal-dependent transcriptional regulator [Saccharofermentans sp.]|nr:metal-dependent transcriptional regulator [Saccharofermentans sp.]